MGVKPYKSSAAEKKEQVAAMFDNIAPKYDFLNHFLSFGIDRLWRRKAIKKIDAVAHNNILDIATGTGDFAIEALKICPDKIVGVDISEGMLNEGRRKVRELGVEKKIELRLGDSESLSFNDNSFDVVSVAFGVRNFENLETGLKEMYRVLKKGGMVCILEFSQPQKFPMKQSYNFYSLYILPFLGRLFSKDKSAYTYLPESVREFPFGEEFKKILRDIGFSQVEEDNLTFGVATIYCGKK
jgi:demethylmenaquinone methyltransferase/2-methoxy-6-polyprenyl-1,4-benzoquinol methylase